MKKIVCILLLFIQFFNIAYSQDKDLAVSLAKQYWYLMGVIKEHDNSFWKAAIDGYNAQKQAEEYLKSIGVDITKFDDDAKHRKLADKIYELKSKEVLGYKQRLNKIKAALSACDEKIKDGVLTADQSQKIKEINNNLREFIKANDDDDKFNEIMNPIVAETGLNLGKQFILYQKKGIPNSSIIKYTYPIQILENYLGIDEPPPFDEDISESRKAAQAAQQAQQSSKQPSQKTSPSSPKPIPQQQQQPQQNWQQILQHQQQPHQSPQQPTQPPTPQPKQASAPQPKQQPEQQQPITPP